MHSRYSTGKKKVRLIRGAFETRMKLLWIKIEMHGKDC